MALPDRLLRNILERVEPELPDERVSLYKEALAQATRGLAAIDVAKLVAGVLGDTPSLFEARFVEPYHRVDRDRPAFPGQLTVLGHAALVDLLKRRGSVGDTCALLLRSACGLGGPPSPHPGLRQLALERVVRRPESVDEGRMIEGLEQIKAEIDTAMALSSAKAMRPAIKALKPKIDGLIVALGKARERAVIEHWRRSGVRTPADLAAARQTVRDLVEKLEAPVSDVSALESAIARLPLSPERKTWLTGTSPSSRPDANPSVLELICPLHRCLWSGEAPVADYAAEEVLRQAVVELHILDMLGGGISDG